MQIDNLVVEVRDRNLSRVAQVMPEDLVGAQFVLKHNDIGSWQLKVHASSQIIDYLTAPGAGIILEDQSGIIMSGPMTSAQLKQTNTDPQGTWIIDGVDDSIILRDRLAYPDPAEADVTAQTLSHDERNGVVETVLKGYVDANLISGPAIRQVDGLTVEADLSRGGVVYGRARFDNLQEFFYGLAQTGGIGYNIRQSNGDLEFYVYEPQDKTSLVRLDIDNGLLTSSNYSYFAPLATKAIVGGAGEMVERLFVEGSTYDSTVAENAWKRRIELFVDARGSQADADLNQEAIEALVDDGKTRVNISVTPSDDQTMLFGDEWGLGDTITVVVADQEVSAVVYSVAISIQADGVYLAADVGTPIPATYEFMIARNQKKQERRLRAIEKTTGYGVVTPYPGVQGGTDGTQPTFSGPVFTATYTRFGDMIYFAYSVDFDNITSFGTGQYYMSLPYPSRRPVTFSGGTLHDVSSNKLYSIIGTVDTGSTTMKLWYVQSNGQQDTFEYNKPITLTNVDHFDITGTYEIEI